MEAGVLSTREEVLTEYRRLREVGRAFGTILLEEVPRNVFFQYAKRLGLLKGKNTLVCDFDEMDVLVDHLIYTFRRRGKTVIQEYFAELAPEPGSDEFTVLQAMMQGRYSLYMVEEVEPGLAVFLTDVLRDVEVRVVDVGMSSTVRKGAGFAGRILPLPDYWITSGAFIPLTHEFFVEELGPVLPKMFPEMRKGKLPHLTPEMEAKLADCVVRAALKWDLLSHMAYADAEDLMD